MDKLKDQDSAAPAATDDKKTISLKKTGKNTKVIINPPEKLDPQRGFQERFKVALAKYTVILEKKTEIVLNAKASSAELPEETVVQVYTRGYKTLPLNSDLTREQYAMNRVNSFIAGGAAMMEDCDLLPIVERVGIKGTGGAMRPHIKREKNVYNGKTVFHVINAKGQVKHTTGDEMQAKKHLAQKYNSYMKEDTVNEAKNKLDSDNDKFKPMMAKLTPQRGKGSFEMKIKEAKDPGEYDQEGDMAMTQLRSIVYHAQQLHDQLNANDNLPEWVQSKITLAQDYMQTAHDYMYSQRNEEVTQEERGLWDNIHDKRKRIKAGSGERMRKPGSEGAPTIDALKRSAVKEEIVSAVEASSPAIRMQRALERIRQSREASEKRAEELLKPKQPQEKK